MLYSNTIESPGSRRSFIVESTSNVKLAGEVGDWFRLVNRANDAYRSLCGVELAATASNFHSARWRNLRESLCSAVYRAFAASIALMDADVSAIE